MSTTESTLETETLTRTHWAVIALAAVTGLIHLGLGIRFISGSLGPPFVLAGLGFFGAIALLLLGYRQPRLYLVGIAYTGIQFVLYFVLNWPDVVTPLGIGDKIVQAALIGLLVVLYQQPD